MALTLAKFMVTSRCSKPSYLHFLNHVSNKSKKYSGAVLAFRNQSTSIAPQIDKFIPLSSRHLYKRLMEENQKLGADNDFENFATGVETTISKQNCNIIPELKFLYSSLDPDLPPPSDLSSHELGDRHFWFMQHFVSLLSSAGFEEIVGIKDKMKEGVIGQGVVVKCDIDKYDVFRVWLMGGQKDPLSTKASASFTEGLFNKPLVWRQPKRVVVVKREKGSWKVDVRMFKGVTSPSLLLPPSGSLKMHPTYKNILLTSSSLSLFFLFLRPSLTWLLGSNHLGSTPMAFAGGFGALSVLLWGVFKHAQKDHLEKVVRSLYDGVVSRNNECLKLLVEKSQEELFKSVLLAHHFLKEGGSEEMKVDELQRRVEGWLQGETGGVVVRVPMEDTVEWMRACSLLHLNPLTNTLSLLPAPQVTHPSRTTHLFHNQLSDTTDSTPISTTIMHNVRKLKGTA